MDNKKLLSALYDGELTEIEEHQLLRQAGVDSSRAVRPRKGYLHS